MLHIRSLAESYVRLYIKPDLYAQNKTVNNDSIRNIQILDNKKKILCSH